MTGTLLVAASFVVFALAIYLASKKARLRYTLLNGTLPNSWIKIFKKDFPRFFELPEDLQKPLGGIAQVLAAEKNFEACGGLEEITEEMLALICIQAALPIMRLPNHRFYPELKSILVYPTAFRDGGRRRFGLHEEKRDGATLGESWQTGSIILSWESVIAGGRNADDGMNVTIHEFAHQLDQINGTDGVPILKNRDAYRQWAKVFERNYEELVEEVNDGKGPEPLIDPYGATNPAEFFAVASETFFEEAGELAEEHPDLYEQLKKFYHLDPVSWGNNRATQ
ncbi:MAG: zinc-dependent peptidase [Verrucomicrobiales bacterium]|nr:zinc-dependent peptidase [Verrucomicrobiales bacterium]